MRKVLRIVLISIVLIVLGILLFIIIIKNRADDIDEDLSGDDLEQIKQEDCVLFIENYLIGYWKDMGSDYPAYLELILKEDQRFEYNVEEVEGERKYTLTGDWIFNNETTSIKFIFDELNEAWIETLSNENMKEDFTGLVDYSLEDKYIEFDFHYMGRENFEHCEENRYFIDWLNVYLYKVED
ncbi:hypothetical protein ACFLY9_00745 [Patescibacteria group bacterium]